MPVYTYRRDDGTTFEVRQKFLDEPLKVDPETGQHVVRVVQAAGIIFKGSGFYVNDSKNASKKSISSPASNNSSSTTNGSSETSKSESAPAATPEKTTTPAAAD